MLPSPQRTSNIRMCHVYLPFFQRSIKWSQHAADDRFVFSFFFCRSACVWAVVMTQMYSRKLQFKIRTNQVLGKNVLFHSLPTLTTSIYRGAKKHIRVTWTRTTNKWTWKFIWRFTFILLQVARIEKASTFLWLCVENIETAFELSEWLLQLRTTFASMSINCMHESLLTQCMGIFLLNNCP